MSRTLSYAQAVGEAVEQEMRRDDLVVVLGTGGESSESSLGMTKDLNETFGPERVMCTPVSGDAMVGVAVGMALAGLRPVHVFSRMDLLLLAMNQIVNVAAKVRYLSGGTLSAPVVIRAVIGAGVGRGPQGSQALHSLFMHVPGLKVVAPSTPYDAKGILTQAIRDPDPVLFVEHRLLHARTGEVPEESYVLPLGKARIAAVGDDITLVGISIMTGECLRAREALREVGIGAEVIDCLSLRPLDIATIAGSVEKTGRLLVVDPGWESCGASAEILARLAELFRGNTPPTLRRMAAAPVHYPASRTLEDACYPDAASIASRAHSIVRGDGVRWMPFIKEGVTSRSV